MKLRLPLKHSTAAQTIISSRTKLSNADGGLLWMMVQDKLVCTGLQILSRDIAKYSAEEIDIAHLTLSQSHPVVLAAKSKQLVCIDGVSITKNDDLAAIQSIDA